MRIDTICVGFRILGIRVFFIADAYKKKKPENNLFW